jgi:Domain of unknown function (DUF4386)
MSNKTTMSKKIIYATAFVLIAEIVTVTVPVAILGSKFNFPDILRQPAANAFVLFRQNQAFILVGYYVFLISALLFIPLSYLLRDIFKESVAQSASQVLVGCGIATTLFQALGFVRWIFTMPYLTESYFGNPENQAAVTIVYETLNRYAGMSIGEHLGFLAMGSWTICLGIIILKHVKCYNPIGLSGICIGLLLIISVAEHFGGAQALLFGKINFIANTLWTVWVLVIALMILRWRKDWPNRIKLLNKTEN